MAVVINIGQEVIVISGSDNEDIEYHVGKRGTVKEIFLDTPTGGLGYYVELKGEDNLRIMFYEHELHTVSPEGTRVNIYMKNDDIIRDLYLISHDGETVFTTNGAYNMEEILFVTEVEK